VAVLSQVRTHSGSRGSMDSRLLEVFGTHASLLA